MIKSERFWDKLANKWDKQSKISSNIKTVESIKQYLNVTDTVLDFGCATGTVAIEIAVKVKKIYGIDISSKMIETASRKAAECKIENIDFAQSTIFDERYKRESFDVILAFHILHLLDDNKKVMRRINELLKPGGLIISATFCKGEKKTFRSVPLFILINVLKKVKILPYVRLFKVSELEDLIRKENFQIIETKNSGHNPTNYFVVAKKT